MKFEAIIRYKCVIEYDGACFKGWQLQPKTKTVQGSVEAILAQVFGRPIRIHGSGRTDTGVHARGQVFHFDLEDDFEPERLLKSFNGMLRNEAIVRSIELTESDFHARFSAKSRMYRYYITEQQIVLNRHFVTFVPRRLDLDLLNEYAHVFIGEHDFTSFSKTNANVDDYRSIVYNASWNRLGDNVVFDVRAIRFLRGMVRALVGTSLHLEKQKADPKMLLQILQEKKRENARFHAPPQGLVLEHVFY